MLTRNIVLSIGSVASIMGLAAWAFGFLVQTAGPGGWAIVIALGIGLACGAFNALFIAGLGIPSLVVTLASLIFAGLAVVAYLVLHRTAFGRKVTFIGASRPVAEYSGTDVGAVKTSVFGRWRCLGPGWAFAGGPGRRGAGRCGQRVRAGHHLHGASGRGQHLRRCRQHDDRQAHGDQRRTGAGNRL